MALLSQREVVELEVKGMQPLELEFNYDLKELKQIAAVLKIKGRSLMNKIQLCMAIDEVVNGVL